MSFKSSDYFTHSQEDKVGVLITNLGTPEAPTAKALRPYLKQFLSDPRVVEFPRLLWWLVLNCIILRIRPARSAKSYETVWTEEGSPLATHTKAQHHALSEALKPKYGDRLIVEWAMRYGQPSVESKIQSLLSQGVRKLFVLPLYPQYSASTSGSTFDAVAADFTKRRWLPELRFLNCYHDRPSYVSAIGDSIKEYWEQHGRADKLIFSYHGIPKRYLTNGDPYHCQCLKTSRLVAEYLGLSKEEYMTSFQSRFGREEWLKPYTDETLKALPAKGIKSVQVVCPGFSSDCLETIEEIGEENREYFEEAGGEAFSYIPALNSSASHIGLLQELVEDNIGSWMSEIQKNDSEQREELYVDYKNAN